MPELDGLTDEQKDRLAQLLDLPDEQLDALAAGDLVLTPDGCWPSPPARTAPEGDDDDDDGVGDQRHDR